jgi:nucleoside-diphosphate-sugar epimerase
LEVVTLRYFNVYGPRQSPFSQYAAAIPIFIESLLSNKQITIFGDGSQTRDLIFVHDIVQANLFAAESSQAPGNVMNICTGIETSVQNLVDTLRKLIPGSREPIYSQPRAGDIYRSSGNPSLARKVMDFYPKTSLEHGLKETIEWMMHQ